MSTDSYDILLSQKKKLQELGLTLSFEEIYQISSQINILQSQNQLSNEELTAIFDLLQYTLISNKAWGMTFLLKKALFSALSPYKRCHFCLIRHFFFGSFSN